MKKLLVAMLGSSILAAPAVAQTPETATDTNEAIIVTGSRIKRVVQDSPLPLQVFTVDDLRRDSVATPEQFISLLTANGTGLDNLASNADVVDGAARGNNGASSANLRGQGASATLILLNGRRVPAHGLNGGVVDINQIPLFAMERVEVLKDGASAIYGTDAVGGVINFITSNNFQGMQAQGFVDVTEAGGGNIYRGSVKGGWGDLEKNGFNVMAGVSYAESKALRGDQRSFVNTFQPDRGLSVDTRGTPHATIMPLGVGPNTPNGTIINSSGVAPFIPGTTIRASGGINPLDLPGGQGCDAIDGMSAYDTDIWNFPAAEYACAWDTGRAAVLQQPLETISYIGRASFRAGEHDFFAEITGSDAKAAKRFSNLQITPNTTTQNYAYARTASNAAIYDRVFNSLVSVFPELEAQRGKPMSYRWRCIECGPREIETETNTLRFSAGADGPIAAGWDYRIGASYGYSESVSTLGSGYYYRNTTRDANGNIIANGIIDALNTGNINVFLLPGETQSAEGMALLEAASAEGVKLYGGKFGLWQIDASVSGPLFDLPGGTVQAAFGVDLRLEDYSFNGDAREAAARPVIIAAPFDDSNALTGASRTVKAAYGEVLVPVFKGFELTGAFRIDDYTGFGTTTNPKISAKYRPIPQLMFRGSYNTSFRVPTFNQLFNGVVTALYTGRDLVDPTTCPGGRPDAANPGCNSITTAEIVTGGRSNLGPETAEQFSLGVVFEPTPEMFLSVDWWQINRDNNIQILPLQDLIDNYDLFSDRFIRDAGGTIVAVDRRWVNTGGTKTEGIEITGRAGFDLGGGNMTIGLDGSYLLGKRSKLVETAEWGVSEVGRYTLSGDLGLRWKHNLFVSYRNDGWSGSISQIFRKGYRNQQLPGVASGIVSPPDAVEFTDNYVTYNATVGFEFNDHLQLTAGVKNIFDTDPPFAVNYDSNLGSGSSWEPRVADPRGRSYTLSVQFTF